MDVEDGQRNTSLHLIVQSGNQPLLKIVAEFDPDYKIANSLGDTPLHVAIQNADSKMARLIVTLGGEELMTIKNRAGLIPSSCCSDQRMKLELSSMGAGGGQAMSMGAGGASTIGGAQSMQRFVHSRTTLEYKKAQQSVLKGDKFD